MCEAQERNERAIYELRGMATEWRVDVPRILQILTGTDCHHEEGNQGVQSNISATAT